MRLARGLLLSFLFAVSYIGRSIAGKNFYNVLSATALDLLVGSRKDLFHGFYLKLSKLSAQPLLRFSNSERADPHFLQLRLQLPLLPSVLSVIYYVGSLDSNGNFR